MENAQAFMTCSAGFPAGSRGPAVRAARSTSATRGQDRAAESSHCCPAGTPSGASGWQATTGAAMCWQAVGEANYRSGVRVRADQRAVLVSIIVFR